MLKRKNSERSGKRTGGEKQLNLYVYFILIVWAVLLVSAACSGLLMFLLGFLFKLPLTAPFIVWILVVSCLISGVATTLLGRTILKPVSVLSRSMKEVAAGNFEVRLTEKSRLKELNDAYESFNIMAAELGTTQMLQADFVSNVSHEFKTPISAIEGYAMLLQGEPGMSAEQEEYVNKILSNTRRVSGLVGNILLLGKLEHQTIPEKKKRFRLDEQIRQALLSLESRWTEKETVFSVEMDEVIFVGVEALLMQVWINLIDNAVKFSPRGSLVTLELTQEETAVRFQITDEGPGISPEAQRHMFDKFYQEDNSHKAEGNGLGLVLVKRIVEVHGGEINAEGCAEGGCRFVIVLPTLKG